MRINYWTRAGAEICLASDGSRPVRFTYRDMGVALVRNLSRNTVLVSLKDQHNTTKDLYVPILPDSEFFLPHGYAQNHVIVRDGCISITDGTVVSRAKEFQFDEIDAYIRRMPDIEVINSVHHS